MERKLLIILITLSSISTSCVDTSETPQVSYVHDLTLEELAGEWEFSTKFRNKKMVERFKPEYLELSKTNFKLRLNADSSIDISETNDTEKKSIGTWKVLLEPEKFTNLKTTWFELNLLDDYNIISGKYYLTQTPDSIFMFKKIWEDFDSSGALRFRKGK